MQPQNIYNDYPFDSHSFLRRFFQAEGSEADRLYLAWQEQDYIHYKKYKGEDYASKFLKTLYWEIVSKAVIARDCHTCRCCHRMDTPESRITPKSRITLQAHHTTYKYLCKDHLHLNVLICLCSLCHTDAHDPKFYATYGYDAIPEDVVYRDWSADDHKDY